MDIEEEFILEHLLFKQRKCKTCGKVKDLMTKNPITVGKNTLATKCLALMQNKKITKIIVGSSSGKKIKVLGILAIHNILQADIK